MSELLRAHLQPDAQSVIPIGDVVKSLRRRGVQARRDEVIAAAREHLTLVGRVLCVVGHRLAEGSR